jgi:hypothetical protein
MKSIFDVGCPSRPFHQCQGAEACRARSLGCSWWPWTMHMAGSHDHLWGIFRQAMCDHQRVWECMGCIKKVTNLRKSLLNTGFLRGAYFSRSLTQWAKSAKRLQRFNVGCFACGQWCIRRAIGWIEWIGHFGGHSLMPQRGFLSLFISTPGARAFCNHVMEKQMQAPIASWLSHLVSAGDGMDQNSRLSWLNPEDP